MESKNPYINVLNKTSSTEIPSVLLFLMRLSNDRNLQHTDADPLISAAIKEFTQ